MVAVNPCAFAVYANRERGGGGERERGGVYIYIYIERERERGGGGFVRCGRSRRKRVNSFCSVLLALKL